MTWQLDERWDEPFDETADYDDPAQEDEEPECVDCGLLLDEDYICPECGLNG